MSSVPVQAENLKKFFSAILNNAGVREDVGRYVVEGIVQASLRGVDSHGIRLFPHYLQGLEEGRLNKNPQYRFTQTTSTAAKLDGDNAPGHAAGAEGMLTAIDLARDTGIGAVAVYNSSHFGAAAYYALMATSQDMIGLSFTHATAHVLSYGGTRPFFGNNPICLAAPCDGEDPFCLDMATTVATFNKVQQYKEQGMKVPFGWGVDAFGRDTDDPGSIESLLPIGGYKGFGLSMMVDILCGLLSGAPCGPDVSRMFGTPMSEKRHLGHFFMALRINCFEDPSRFKKRLKDMMDALRREPRQSPEISVMVPGDPEKAFLKRRSESGIPVPHDLLDKLEVLAGQYNVAFELYDQDAQ
ncbi:MAG: Ldh family oxidoreductase [Syntrophaceae bacterium]